MKNKAILVVSFGSSLESARNNAIYPIERLIETTYTEYKVTNAYTSNFVREKLKKQGIHFDSVDEALDNLIKEGFLEIYIQPLHILAGFEYEKVQDAVRRIEKEDVIIKLGEPLLLNDDDLESIAEVLKEHKDYLTIYVGHGTEHPMHGIYERLEGRMKADNQNIYVGTIEEGPNEMLHRLKPLSKISNTAQSTVMLKPFLLVAGDHVVNDINGTSSDSWISVFEQSGYDVLTDLRGLGELEGVQQLFLKKVANLIKEGE